jgi:E3 ubiquitin-protein ligase RBBP6
MVTSTAEEWHRRAPSSQVQRLLTPSNHLLCFARSQQQFSRAPGRGRGRFDGGRGRGRSDGAPPPGYVCKRCCSTGHWISNCPTNSDPDYERRKVRQPIGIPLARLQATDEGTLLLPDGQSATLTAAEDILERELGFLRREKEGAAVEESALAVLPPPAPFSTTWTSGACWTGFARNPS